MSDDDESMGRRLVIDALAFVVARLAAMTSLPFTKAPLDLPQFKPADVPLAPGMWVVCRMAGTGREFAVAECIEVDGKRAALRNVAGRECWMEQQEYSVLPEDVARYLRRLADMGAQP